MEKVYELHKTWCADTLLSNSVICAIGVLQHTFRTPALLPVYHAPEKKTKMNNLHVVA